MLHLWWKSSTPLQGRAVTWKTAKSLPHSIPVLHVAVSWISFPCHTSNRRHLHHHSPGQHPVPQVKLFSIWSILSNSTCPSSPHHYIPAHISGRSLPSYTIRTKSWTGARPAFWITANRSAPLKAGQDPEPQRATGQIRNQVPNQSSSPKFGYNSLLDQRLSRPSEV